MNINEKELLSFNHQEIDNHNYKEPLPKITEISNLIKGVKRPVILAGNAIRLANAEKEFLDLVETLSFPVLTSKRGADLLPDDHPLFFGRPGAYGQRSGANNRR